MKLGGIYKTELDERPVRIIGSDKHETFYDCLWENDKWIFSGNLKRKCSFYRIPTEFLNSKSEFIELKPLTETEQNCFRPDLPMRFGRTKKVSWNEFNSNSLRILESLYSDQKINAESIILVPFGPKGGTKKGVKIESENGFTVFEIIEKAKKIQEDVNENPSNGIGMYRLGIQKGIPSYYIGEYIDKADFLSE